jgi:hypothetical protein
MSRSVSVERNNPNHESLIYRPRDVVELKIPKDPALQSAASPGYQRRLPNGPPNALWLRALGDPAGCVIPIGPIHDRVHEMPIQYI